LEPTLLIWPLLIHGFVTLFLFLPMSRVRRRLIAQGKVKASAFRLVDGEPEESRKFSNALRNQNETGLLYYAGLLVAFVTGNATGLIVGLAWLFLALKLAHVAVHATVNKLRYRFPLFTAALVTLVALWLALAARLAHLI
jgi:hypothetical protein